MGVSSCDASIETIRQDLANARSAEQEAGAHYQRIVEAAAVAAREAVLAKERHALHLKYTEADRAREEAAGFFATAEAHFHECQSILQSAREAFEHARRAEQEAASAYQGCCQTAADSVNKLRAAQVQQKRLEQQRQMETVLSTLQYEAQQCEEQLAAAEHDVEAVCGADYANARTSLEDAKRMVMEASKTVNTAANSLAAAITAHRASQAQNEKFTSHQRMIEQLMQLKREVIEEEEKVRLVKESVEHICGAELEGAKQNFQEAQQAEARMAAKMQEISVALNRAKATINAAQGRQKQGQQYSLLLVQLQEAKETYALVQGQIEAAEASVRAACGDTLNVARVEMENAQKAIHEAQTKCQRAASVLAQALQVFQAAKAREPALGHFLDGLGAPLTGDSSLEQRLREAETNFKSSSITSLEQELNDARKWQMECQVAAREAAAAQQAAARKAAEAQAMAKRREQLEQVRNAKSQAVHEYESHVSIVEAARAALADARSAEQAAAGRLRQAAVVVQERQAALMSARANLAKFKVFEDALAKWEAALSSHQDAGTQWNVRFHEIDLSFKAISSSYEAAKQDLEDAKRHEREAHDFAQSEAAAAEKAHALAQA